MTCSEEETGDRLESPTNRETRSFGPEKIPWTLRMSLGRRSHCPDAGRGCGRKNHCHATRVAEASQTGITRPAGWSRTDRVAVAPGAHGAATCPDRAANPRTGFANGHGSHEGAHTEIAERDAKLKAFSRTAENRRLIDTRFARRVSFWGCSVFDARSICVPSKRFAVNLLALNPDRESARNSFDWTRGRFAAAQAK